MAMASVTKSSQHAAMEQRDETTVRVSDTVSESTVSETEDASASGDDFEMQVAERSVTSTGDEADEADAAVTERAVATATKCAHCNNRKLKNCVNLACKRCCLRVGTDCAVHIKAPEPAAPTATTAEPVALHLRKTRKPVLKNEFKESNVLYYGESVTLFCLRDFFQGKKLSQPLLNDQTRRLRATGAGGAALSTASNRATKRRGVADAELKKRVASAVWGDAKRRKVPSQ